MRFSPFALVLLGAPCAPLAMSFPAQAAASAGQAADLAQAVEGRWRGDVTSDIRGSSRGGVTITVERVARNRVRISCDYPRIPTVEVDLMTAGGSIMNARPGVTFLIELQRDANRLDLYIDEASLIVRR